MTSAATNPARSNPRQRPRQRGPLAYCGDADANRLGDGEANAKLIAAAPHLLEALRELVNRCWLDTERHVYSLDSKGCGADVAALDAARAALARATA